MRCLEVGVKLLKIHRLLGSGQFPRRGSSTWTDGPLSSQAEATHQASPRPRRRPPHDHGGGRGGKTGVYGDKVDESNKVT